MNREMRRLLEKKKPRGSNRMTTSKKVRNQQKRIERILKMDDGWAAMWGFVGQQR